MKTLLSYIRWSSDEQGKGDSLTRQKGMIDAYIKSHPDMLVDPEHQYFDKGVSSFKQVLDPNDIDGEIMRSVNRATGDLSRLFANIDAKKIPRDSVLIVEQIDRLGRSAPTQALEDFLKLVNYGIEIVTLADGMVYNKATANANMTSIMMYFMKAWVGYEESLKKSVRQQSVTKNRIEQAIKHGKPLGANVAGWLIHDKENDKYVVDESKANVARHIYKLRLEGNSFYRIAIMLNESNTPPINRRKIRKERREAIEKAKREGREVKTGDWSRESVKYLLRTETVLGTLPEAPSHPAIPHYYPAIIDFATFNTVQSMSTYKNCGKSSNTDSPLYVNIFRKLLTCGDCGLTMTAAGVRPPVYYGVYRCNCFIEKRKREPKTSDSNLSSQGLKRAEMKRLGRKLNAEKGMICRTASRKIFDLALCHNLFANLAQYATDQSDRLKISQYEEEQKKLKTRIKKLRLMILDDEENGDIDPELLAEINQSRRREKELDGLLKKELVRANSTDYETLAGLDLVNSAADRTQAQMAVSKLVKGITVYGSRHTCDVYFYNGSVIREFDYLADDDMTETLRGATDNAALKELADITGDRSGVVFHGQTHKGDTPPHDFTGWPDAEESDYPNTDE